MSVRLTIVETHPIQYKAPWYRYLSAQCPEIDLTVVYAGRPSANQQGLDFGTPFEWDTPLLDGYRSVVVRDDVPAANFGSSSFRGLDIPEIGRAVLDTDPDVVLVSGWHSITQLRAIRACYRRGIPLLYRGDSHLRLRPDGWRGLAWSAKTRVLLGFYSAYLAVGSRSREYLLAHGARPTAIYASPHTVDNDWFALEAAPHLTADGRASARASFGLGDDDFGVLFAGKLTRHKHAIDAVRACAAVGAALIVAGDGSDRAEAEREAERLGVRVSWPGFLNQRRMAQAYAAADCLLVPSFSESWGLAVNEAMATGLPAVVSERVGCAPDLVVPGETGEIAPTGDIPAFAAALRRVRDRGGRLTMGAACRAAAARHGFAQAAAGLVGASQAVARQRTGAPRVVACCGGMVVVSGLERMTFEVLRVVRQGGGSVHCIVNSWENQRIVPMADRIGASWSTGYYWYAFTSRTLNPIRQARSLWDVIRTSAGLVRDAWRFGATHVLVPEWGAVLRNAPALALLRLAGVSVVFRIANAPERGRLHAWLWRRVFPPLVTWFVPNSRFSRERLEQTGVPARKIALIHNAMSRRTVADRSDEDVVRLARSRPTILVVGQIAPFKGTHLAVDATLALLAEGRDVQTIVVGAVPVWPDDLVAYVADLRDRAGRAGRSDRVHFVGARENVPAIMQASFVLAAPILQEETFGNVALEARTVGLPVVAFARGGLGELVAHRETGYVCPTADVAGLLEGLRYFLAHPQERDRVSARALAESARPDSEYSRSEFERRWWRMFAAGAHS